MQELPVKFRVVQIIAQQEGISNDDLYHILKREYPQDRHVTPQGVESYLMALKAVGLIRLTRTKVSGIGSIIQQYQLTEAGVSKLKYID